MGSAHYSSAIPRFLRFLNTLDKPTIQIRATTLTYKLRLDYLPPAAEAQTPRDRTQAVSQGGPGDRLPPGVV